MGIDTSIKNHMVLVVVVAMVVVVAAPVSGGAGGAGGAGGGCCCCCCCCCGTPFLKTHCIHSLSIFVGCRLQWYRTGHSLSMAQLPRRAQCSSTSFSSICIQGISVFWPANQQSLSNSNER